MMAGGGGERDFGAALADLRASFDDAFARPPSSATRDEERLVVLEVAGRRIGVRLAELQGLERTPRVVPLPGAPPRLLGVAGIRGRIVPVYALGALLGGAEPAAGAEAPAVSETGRWLALVGVEEPLGLAVDAVFGLLDLPRAEVARAGEREAGVGGADARHVVAVARTASGPLPVVSLATVVAEVRGSGGSGGAGPGRAIPPRGGGTAA